MNVLSCFYTNKRIIITLVNNKKDNKMLLQDLKNVYEMLQRACNENKNRIFFVRQNETYADLLKAVKKRAVLLARRFNIKRGDTVALLSGNTPEFIKSYFAIISQGARVLMLDTGLSKNEHLNMMQQTNCKLALAQKCLISNQLMTRTRRNLSPLIAPVTRLRCCLLHLGQRAIQR